mgnify:FL=1
MKKSRVIILCIFWILLVIVLALRLFTNWIPDTVNAAVSMVSFLVFGVVEFLEWRENRRKIELVLIGLYAIVILLQVAILLV